MTRTFAVFGSGGVGKTTTSAALAVALAQSGQRTLVTTVDPARRLADVLGMPGLPGEHNAEVRAVPGRPNLSMFMPESGSSARSVAASLLRHHPDKLASLADNAVFEMLCGGLAGVHELASLTDLSERFEDYDALVIDTAPSRHGVELLSLPRRLQELVDGRALRWLGQLSRDRLEERRGRSLGRLLGWGKRRFVAGLEHTLGGSVVADAMEVLDAVALVRQELSANIAAAERMLCSRDVSYWVVLSPSMGGVDQARRSAEQIAAAAGRPPHAFVLNRAVAAAPPWPEVLASLDQADSDVRADARAAADELAECARRAAAADEALAGAFPTAVRLRVPPVAAGRDATAVVECAAEHLAAQHLAGDSGPPAEPVRHPNRQPGELAAARVPGA